MSLFLPFAILFAGAAALAQPKHQGERTALLVTGLAFLVSLILCFSPFSDQVIYGLQLSKTTFLMFAVVCFISLVIQAYALRHFDGDRRQSLTTARFLALTIALLLFVSADHLLLSALGLGLSNYLLVQLMVHNPQWQAARFSGRLALQHLGGGVVALLLAAAGIYWTQGHLSLQQLSTGWTATPLTPVIGVLIVIAALAQSAIWPFHRWLIASANAPTPVSAFMHAGLVNGGALILYKLYPVIAQLPWVFTILILLGGITAIVGTTWMLVQSDVKRTLTCSTMGQMGFMIMQCGLGLFPAAIAHMIWHGFFKASLFLSAGSTVKAAKNQSLRLHGPSALPIFLFGLAMGLAGTWIFWQFTHHTGSLQSTYLFLLVFCGITCAHAVMTILQPQPALGRALLAATLGLLGSVVYGASVWAVESQLSAMVAQPLAGWHVAILVLFVIGWLLMIFRRFLPASATDGWIAPLYMRALRGSQPSIASVNTRRGEYRL